MTRSQHQPQSELSQYTVYNGQQQASCSMSKPIGKSFAVLSMRVGHWQSEKLLRREGTASPRGLPSEACSLLSRSSWRNTLIILVSHTRDCSSTRSSLISKSAQKSNCIRPVDSKSQHRDKDSAIESCWGRESRVIIRGVNIERIAHCLPKL
jgi:hypothetical protein